MKNERLIKAIEESGYKRTFIAEKIGISRAQLYNLEMGRDFNTKIGLRLEKLLGVPLLELIPPSSRGGFSSVHAS